MTGRAVIVVTNPPEALEGIYCVMVVVYAKAIVVVMNLVLVDAVLSPLPQ